ncbi:MAG TPA: fibronectin type III domain-containing protein [Polyangiaceae bacterium]
MNPTHRVRAVLTLPKTKVATLLAIAKAVHNAFQSNPGLLPQPNPPLPAVQGQIQGLDTAQQATSTRTKGTVATRNARRDVLVTSLESWRMYVQTLCDANPEQAEELIAAAGMTVAKVPAHPKPVLAARLGTASGSVTLNANASLLAGRRKHAAFAWQYSADGGKTWTNAPATPLASTSIEGLTPLTTYAFRVAATVSKTVGAWSQAVTLIVH